MIYGTPDDKTPRTAWAVLHWSEAQSPRFTAPLVSTAGIDRIDGNGVIHFRCGDTMLLDAEAAAALRLWLANPHIVLQRTEGGAK